MKNGNIEKLIINSFKAIFLIGALIFGLKFLDRNDRSPIEGKKIKCLERKKTEIKGVVLENNYSRGSYHSELSNGLLLKWYCKSKVMDILEVGDSIYKPQGTFNTYIYKKANPDSVIYIECDFDCDYWEKKYGHKYN